MVVTFVYVYVQCLLISAVGRLDRRASRWGQQGQASAEYALVLLGAAGVALLVGAWAKRSGSVGRLLDGVLEELLARVR